MPIPGEAPTGGKDTGVPQDLGGDEGVEPIPAGGVRSVTIGLTSVPADKVRDVLKAAILSLAATGATVDVDMQINASSENGIPGETLDLTVAEGLRQLGLNFEIDKR